MSKKLNIAIEAIITILISAFFFLKGLENMALMLLVLAIYAYTMIDRMQNEK